MNYQQDLISSIKWTNLFLAMRPKLCVATAALVSATMMDYDSFDQISEDILSKRTDVYNAQWPESGIRVKATEQCNW